jgi:STAS-like domain of unknown function (DUF4325)
MNQMIILIEKKTGLFAENKDVAREIRIKEILPSLEKNDKVVLDFSGVEVATQSFVHALLSEAFHKNGAEVLNKILFKSCNSAVQNMIEVVTTYLQETLPTPSARRRSPA